jgi:hypothetical protein
MDDAIPDDDDEFFDDACFAQLDAFVQAHEEKKVQRP